MKTCYTIKWSGLSIKLQHLLFGTATLALLGVLIISPILVKLFRIIPCNTPSLKMSPRAFTCNSNDTKFFCEAYCLAEFRFSRFGVIFMISMTSYESLRLAEIMLMIVVMRPLINILHTKLSHDKGHTLTPHETVSWPSFHTIVLHCDHP